MLSMMLRARSFDASDYKVGQKIKFPMADGGKVEEQTLIYRGKKNFKMEESNTAASYSHLWSIKTEKKKKWSHSTSPTTKTTCPYAWTCTYVSEAPKLSSRKPKEYVIRKRLLLNKQQRDIISFL